jgi:NADH:ubiquinone oxidoreductase 24 kD subunit
MSHPATEAGLAARISTICAAHAELEGPLLPILHEVQAEIGYIPEAAIPRDRRHTEPRARRGSWRDLVLP